MEVIVDDSFILACMRKRIDFVAQLTAKGFRVRVPKEVLQTLKDRKFARSASHEDRVMIDEFLQLASKKVVREVPMGQQKIEDWLVHKGLEGIYIATTLASVKRKIPRRIGIFESRGEVDIET